MAIYINIWTVYRSDVEVSPMHMVSTNYLGVSQVDY